MVEDTRMVSSHPRDENAASEDAEEKEVETLATIEVGENVRQKGSDLQNGDKVLENGHIIGNTGGDIGTLAYVGRKSVRVPMAVLYAMLMPLR